MKENKILAWVNAHKKQIAFAAGCATAGMIAFAIRQMTSSQDLEIPELDIGTITELWKEGNEDVIRMISEDLTVADLGRFGEELAETFENVTPESAVSAFIGVSTK